MRRSVAGEGSIAGDDAAELLGGQWSERRDRITHARSGHHTTHVHDCTVGDEMTTRSNVRSHHTCSGSAEDSRQKALAPTEENPKKVRLLFCVYCVLSASYSSFNERYRLSACRCLRAVLYSYLLLFFHFLTGRMTGRPPPAHTNQKSMNFLTWPMVAPVALAQPAAAAEFDRRAIPNMVAASFAKAAQAPTFLSPTAGRLKLQKIRPAVSADHDLARARGKMPSDTGEPSRFPGGDPPLWVGTGAHAADIKLLKRLGIGAVLNCAPSVCIDPTDKYERQSILYCEIDARDDREYPLLKECLALAREFIGAAHDAGRGVLVHCMAGVNRSATLAVAHLLLRDRPCLFDLVRDCVEARPSILQNQNFQLQLCALAQRNGLLFESAYSRTIVANEADASASTKAPSAAPTAAASAAGEPSHVEEMSAPLKAHALTGNGEIGAGPSPIAPHPSPFIPHSSSLTPHPSSLTIHPSPSPLTIHPSPFVPHSSPLTQARWRKTWRGRHVPHARASLLLLCSLDTARSARLELPKTPLEVCSRSTARRSEPQPSMALWRWRHGLERLVFSRCMVYCMPSSQSPQASRRSVSSTVTRRTPSSHRYSSSPR